MRGLKIGDTLIDLAEIAEENIAHGNNKISEKLNYKNILLTPKNFNFRFYLVSEGVLPNCQVKCDAEPCKNGGVCTENFAKRESYCNCEHTSFLGEFCMEEKGADFSGESSLQRKFTLTGPVNKIKLQLAFSSSDLRRASRVMLLLQTENDRSYYLMVAITADGFLQFEEDREGSSFGAKMEKNFLNNIRHSIYYTRTGADAFLLIDREEVPLEPISTLALTPVADQGSTGVQIGGINTTDPRFAVYKSYSGCLSSKFRNKNILASLKPWNLFVDIFVEVNNISMKPLEEYMLFTKSGAENISVIHSQGVRSAQCSMEFDVTQKLIPEPSLNFSVVRNDFHLSRIPKYNFFFAQGSDKSWNENEPKRIPYKSQHVDLFRKEEKTQVVFIVLTILFVVIVICCLIEVYRTNRAHKKRIERETDESIIWAKEQAAKIHENSFAYKPVRIFHDRISKICKYFSFFC